MDLSTLLVTAVTPKVIADVLLDLARFILGGREELEYSKTQIVTAILYAFLICLLFASGGILLVIALKRHISRPLLVAEICLAAGFLGSLPILSRFLETKLNRYLVLALECTSFVGLLLTFSVEAMHLPITSPWPLYAIALVLLLVGGAELVNEYKERTLDHLLQSLKKRIDVHGTDGSQEPVELFSQNVRNGLIEFDRVLKDEVFLYVALPLGVALGVIRGYWRTNTLSIVSVCFETVLELSSLVIVLFLFRAFRRMSNPGVLLKAPALALDTGRRQCLDDATVLTEMRKVDFANAVHDTMLLISFLGLALLLSGVVSISDITWAAVGVAIVSVAFLNQLPFTLGQLRLHSLLLKPYRGWERAENIKKLNEILPAVPKLEVLAAFLGEASVGGLAFSVAKSLREVAEKFRGA